MSIRVHYCAIWVALLVTTGCAHLGARVERGAVPPGAPKTVLKDILTDLAANESALRSFKAGGDFYIKTAESPALQHCDGKVFFRKPSDLYVEGWSVLGAREFKLVCKQDRYWIWYKGQLRTGSGAEPVEGISWKVTPSEIVREMFLPETWSQVDIRQAHLTEYDEGRHKAAILLGSEKNPRRRLEVTGPPWDVTKNELFDPKTGKVVASTTLSDYREKSGVRYPKTIAAEFPVQEMTLKFDITNPELNTPLDDTRFTIKEADTK